MFSTSNILLEILNKYINERQKEGGLLSRYDIPEQEEHAKYRYLADKFDIYMKEVATNEAHTHIDHLLEWLDGWCNESWVKTYDKFLLLAQAVAQRGYKTAIDVPLTEDEFHYRKYIREFDAWMKKHPNNDKSHLECLLVWLEKKSDIDDLTYQQFLIMANLMAKKGYATMIDVPMSETEFNDFILDKIKGYREFADKLVNIISASNRQRRDFVNRFYLMAYAIDPNASSYNQSRRLTRAIQMEIEAIRSEYNYSNPLFTQGLFSSSGSSLYSMIKSQLGIKSTVNKSEREDLLDKFNQFVIDNSSNRLSKFHHLDSEQNNEEKSDHFRMGAF